ncbi:MULTISPECIES: helix-turn-helix domain-containing protein [Methylobacterium]|uniref:helix-turn-helix domain-containing protein n=1 Tax=Methylobacterium TaxID=407 RepID=UPI00272E5459|nr:helix-turn-helix transcriptional regulator [Methylobacterium sp.]
MYPSGTQIRAARALLKMSREELASLAGVSERTITNLEETDRKPIRATIEAVMGSLIGQGIRFLPPDPETGAGPGVRIDR